MLNRHQLQNFDYSTRPNNLKDESQIREVLRRMEAWESQLEAQGLMRHAKIIKNASIQAVEHNNFDYAKSLYQLRTDVDWPVTMEEFIEDEDFLGGSIKIWPKLKEELIIMAPDLMAGAQPITEVLNRSTIGTGKSEIGKVLLLYHIYFLCCFKNPQLLYPDLNKHTTILFVMQSVRDYITRRVLYEPARDMFTEMTWVKKNILWDKDKESTLILENKVGLVPMLATAGAIIGQAVIGGHIDEANFMEVVQESKKTSGPSGTGGLYDQAEETYSAMSRRRRSRFITQGPNPGCIYVSSSVNYKMDFLDKRIDKVRLEKPENVKHVHIIDFRQADVRPNTFSGVTFKFLVGTNDYEPKILENNEVEGRDYPTGALVEEVPVEFIDDFRHDPDKAQRDTLGISSSAIHRFISQVSKIVNAVNMGKSYGLQSFLDQDNVVLAQQRLREPDSLGLPIIQRELLPKDLKAKRYVHVDLSRSGDRCGIAMSRVSGYTAVTSGSVVQMLPTYIVELAVSIEPDTQNHIDIADVRAWILKLKEEFGLNIVQVTYDGFDSRESIQQWRKIGISSFEISMDKTPEAYNHLKTAIYQDRVLLSDNALLATELAQLEVHITGGRMKINHPRNFGKDIADAVAGSVKSASMNRMVRTETDVTDTAGNSLRDPRRREIERRRARRR